MCNQGRTNDSSVLPHSQQSVFPKISLLTSSIGVPNVFFIASYHSTSTRLEWSQIPSSQDRLGRSEFWELRFMERHVLLDKN